MAYKLFISFTGKDRILAEEIHNQLINAFRGKVDVFISSQSLSPGERWIDKIKTTLSDFDGILCLITTNSINKQWIFVEWSAFWLNDKDIFICMNDNSLSESLIQPVKETQYMLINQRNDVESFFKVLSEKSNTSPIPYNFVETYIEKINKAIELQQMDEIEKYLLDINNLPEKDDIKIEIAKYCLYKDKFEYLPKILSIIRSDYLKTNLANELINSNQLSKIEYIFEFIRASQNLTEIVINLIDNQFEDIHIYKKIIDSISLKDQSQLFNIAQYLIQLNKENSNLFKYVVEKFANMAELRKIAFCLIDCNKFKTELFRNIIVIFEDKNRTELRKIGEYLIKNSLNNDDELLFILEILKRKNVEQYNMLLEFKNNL